MHKCCSWRTLIAFGLSFVGLAVFAVWKLLVDADILTSVTAGLLFLVIAGVFLFQGMRMIRMESSGITEYIGPFTLKYLPADQIRTVVKYATHGRGTIFVYLVFSHLPASELEAQGERRLRKEPLIRDLLKYRKSKPDWGDLCLGGGFRRKGMLWIEYSEERKARIQSLYPNAEYREAKLIYSL